MQRPKDSEPSRLPLGEMPIPRYIRTMLNADGYPTKWIGIEAYALDGNVKEFLWYRNIQSDISEPLERSYAAAFLARLKVGKGIDAAYGPGVDVMACSRETGFVQTIDDPQIVGLYIEADHRVMFNWEFGRYGVLSEADLRRDHPVEFDEAFEGAKAVLPRPR